jgi:hypothetical protein
VLECSALAKLRTYVVRYFRWASFQGLGSDEQASAPASIETASTVPARDRKVGVVAGPLEFEFAGHGSPARIRRDR